MPATYVCTSLLYVSIGTDEPVTGTQLNEQVPVYGKKIQSLTTRNDWTCKFHDQILQVSITWFVSMHCTTLKSVQMSEYLIDCNFSRFGHWY